MLCTCVVGSFEEEPSSTKDETADPPTDEFVDGASDSHEKTHNTITETPSIIAGTRPTKIKFADDASLPNPKPLVEVKQKIFDYFALIYYEKLEF
jgi:hypothetical protein